jgi:hydrogenase-1 operon protein HyaF
VRPDKASLCYAQSRTGMANAVLTEIAGRLEALADSGVASAIDLKSLPLTEADLADLEELLGQGEVSAELEVVGRTTVRETAYAGVWWIRHFGGGEQVAAEEIAITPVPEILGAHPEDITAAAERIRLQLDAGPQGAEIKEASNG